MNPVEIDALFQETNQLLAISPSERVKLNLIGSFLEEVEGKEKVYGSYIEQLIIHIPEFSQPLLYTGIDPQKLLVFIQRLEQYEKIVEKTEIRIQVREKIDLYIEIAGIVQGWLGESPDEKTMHKELVKLEKATKRVQQDGVLVPVVEELSGRKTGRLRRVQVEMIGPSKNGNQLKPTFGVIGGDAGTFLKSVESAVTKFAEETISRSHKHWMASIHFELGQAWHAGGSANLAIAGCFYSEILKAEEQQELFWLNPTSVITGELDDSGTVSPVNESTLQLKIEGAFFSWAQILVVPKDQLNSATKFIHQLQQRYPNRHLPVMGVSHLKELFYDRRTVLYKKETTLTHSAKKVWKRKFSTGSIVLIVLLLMVIGRLVMGPVDRNPTLYEYSGEYLVVKNAHGIEVGRYKFSYEQAESVINLMENLPKVTFGDITGDEVNEVFYGEWINAGVNKNGSIKAWSVTGDSLIWENPLEIDLEFPRQHGVTQLFYNVEELQLATDKTGNQKLIAAINSRTSFPSVIARIDINSGEIEDYYLHTGKTTDLNFFDIDDDGTDEILAIGINNAFWLAHLVVLDQNELSGHSPTQGDYFPANIKPANEMAYVLFPKTIVGVAFSSSEKYNQGRHFKIREDYDYFSVYIQDASGIRITEGNRLPTVIYRFSKDLSVQSIITSDGYDINARWLFNEGRIPFEPGYDYFEAFKDSLLYWDGEEFVRGKVERRE